MKTFHRSLLISLLPLAPLALVADPEANPDPVAPAGDHGTGEAAIGAAWRASEVIGTAVKNTGGEEVGKVEDLVVDLKTGEILAVVVSAGGFLGIGDTLSTVSPSRFSYDAGAEAFVIPLTKEELHEAPRFESSGWNVRDSAVVQKLREWRDSVSERTGGHREERAADGVTAAEQGNSEADLNTTREIRAAVVGEDLSFSAKNVTIVTRDGKVTLRGTVDSQEEHRKVLEIARTHAGSASVDDQLEVKQP